MQVMPEHVSTNQLISALQIDFTTWVRNEKVHALRKAIARFVEDDMENPRLETAYFFLQPERVNIYASRVISSWVRDAFLRGEENDAIHFQVGKTSVRFLPKEFPVNDLMELLHRGYYVEDDLPYPYNGSDADSYVCFALDLIRNEKKLFGLELDPSVIKPF